MLKNIIALFTKADTIPKLLSLTNILQYEFQKSYNFLFQYHMAKNINDQYMLNIKHIFKSKF